MKSKQLTDIQTKTVIKIIDLGNKLAKVSPEYRKELYIVKHGIINYIMRNKKHFVKSIIPMINNDSDTLQYGRHRLLEVDINGTIFHLPYHKNFTYGFNWTDDIVPIEYTKPDEKEIALKLKESIDPFKVFLDLFQIYVQLCSGMHIITSGTIQYWYTKYVIRLLRKNPNLDLTRCESGGSDSDSDTEKYWIKYNLIDKSNGNIIETKEFRKYYKEAKMHYNDFFRQSIGDICKKYE